MTLRDDERAELDRLRAEVHRLRDSEQRYRSVIAAMSEGVVVQDATGEIVACNAAAERILGLTTDQMAGRTSLDPRWRAIHEDGSPFPGDTHPSMVTLRTGAPCRNVIMGVHKPEGGLTWIEINSEPVPVGGGEPARVVVTFNDITEARRLERELRQTQRLEAVGRLAGGVAHDFNNVLTAISSAVELASRPGRDPRNELALIRDAVDRAARLTRHLLAFARHQAIGVTTFDLGAMVDELRPLLGHLLGERIQLVIERAPGAWTVRADHGQLEQVVVNLVANARDAIADTGRVLVRVGAPAGGGDDVALVVEDDGAGMDPDVLDHVFEPFFTTKEAGTGLGLPSCYGIVEQHGGHIDVRSQVGVGTRIEVRLPRSDEPVAPSTAVVAAPAARGAETLLLVEDDPVIRGLTERILAEQGYELVVARDGVEALELVRDRIDELALVLTDVVMPRLGGVALVRRLRELRPELPALLITGYAPDAQVTAELPTLDKPYSPETLVRVVGELLAGARLRGPR